MSQVCMGRPDTPGSHDCTGGHQQASGILASDSFHPGSSDKSGWLQGMVFSYTCCHQENTAYFMSV